MQNLKPKWKIRNGFTGMHEHKQRTKVLRKAVIAYNVGCKDEKGLFLCCVKEIKAADELFHLLTFWRIC